MLERDTTYFRIVCTIFWIQACFGFVADELLPLGFMDTVHSILFLACDAVAMTIGLACLKGRKQILIVVTFAILSVVSTIFINHESIISLFNGAREFVGIIFATPILYYLAHCKRAAEFKKSFEKQLKILLYLQVPCVVWQFIRYGAGDHGGGTFGNWHSGCVSTLICLTSFYFFTRDYDHDDMLGSFRRNWKYIFLLFPIFLNETKVSFVYLAIYAALLYRFDFKSLRKFLTALPLLIIAAYGAYIAYDTATGASEMGLDVAESGFVEKYLTGGTADDVDDILLVNEAVRDGELDTGGQWDIEIPRVAKIALTPAVLANVPGGLTFGAGLGQFKGGTTIDTTQFAKDYNWLLYGTRPWLLAVLIQLGVLGAIWFVCCMFFYMNYKMFYSNMAKQVKYYITSILLIMILYNDILRLYDFCWVLFLIAALTTYDWIPSNKTQISYHNENQ